MSGQTVKEIAEEYDIKGGGSTNTVQGGTSSIDLNAVIHQFFSKIKTNKI